jgi:hypothetical protein
MAFPLTAFPLTFPSATTMQPTLSSLFDDAENRYLNGESLTELHRYVKSMPSRVAVYRLLRDNEVKIMQVVADRLSQEFSAKASVETIECTLRHGLLVMRHGAMAMLMDDAHQLEEKLFSWLRETMLIHDTTMIDRSLYKYLKQVLAKALNPQQMALVEPLFVQIQTVLLAADVTTPATPTAAGSATPATPTAAGSAAPAQTLITA